MSNETEAEASIKKVYQLLQGCKNLEIDDRLAQGLDTGTYQQEDLATILEIYKIIKKRAELKKRSELPEGEQVLTESKEEFSNFCRSLIKDFKGAMRLYGKLDGKLYTAGLLLEKGNVLAASFEDVYTEEIMFREEAISQIKNRFSGTKGDLEVYAFNDGDMEKAGEGNKEALLTSSIPLLSLGMKVRSKVKTWAKETVIESVGRGERPKIKELKTEGGFNLVDFAHKFPKIFSSKTGQLKKEKIIEKKEGISVERSDQVVVGLDGIMNDNASSGKSINSYIGDLSKVQESIRLVSDLTRERLNELKRKRHVESIALKKKIAKIKGKGHEESIKEKNKIQTPIDKLYYLVQKHDRVKIDDKLGKILGVERYKLEGWAVILEKYDLAELHYPTLGAPEIRKATKSVDNALADY